MIIQFLGFLRLYKLNIMNTNIYDFLVNIILYKNTVLKID